LRDLIFICNSFAAFMAPEVMAQKEDYSFKTDGSYFIFSLLIKNPCVITIRSNSFIHLHFISFQYIHSE